MIALSQFYLLTRFSDPWTKYEISKNHETIQTRENQKSKFHDRAAYGYLVSTFYEFCQKPSLYCALDTKRNWIRVDNRVLKNTLRNAHNYFESTYSGFFDFYWSYGFYGTY